MKTLKRIWLGLMLASWVLIIIHYHSLQTSENIIYQKQPNHLIKKQSFEAITSSKTAIGNLSKKKIEFQEKHLRKKNP